MQAGPAGDRRLEMSTDPHYMTGWNQGIRDARDIEQTWTEWVRKDVSRIPFGRARADWMNGYAAAIIHVTRDIRFRPNPGVQYEVPAKQPRTGEEDEHTA
jgi:hypothetical protein